MTRRVATCRCGQLQLACTGDPVRISVCHCLNCQRRSGSAFAVQARWPDERIELTGAYREWTDVRGGNVSATFRFCPDCGGTVAFFNAGMPGVTAVPVGAFADPSFPTPTVSIYEERQHGWVAVTGDGIEHID